MQVSRSLLQNVLGSVSRQHYPVHLSSETEHPFPPLTSWAHTHTQRLPKETWQLHFCLNVSQTVGRAGADHPSSVDCTSTLETQTCSMEYLSLCLVLSISMNIFRFRKTLKPENAQVWILKLNGWITMLSFFPRSGWMKYTKFMS